MSHVATVELEIKDLACLKKACKELGLEFRENQNTFRWYGQWVNDYGAQDAAYKNGIKTEDYGKCLHAIGIPNNNKAYEVGVVKAPNGPGFTLVWDFYAGGHGLQAAIGQDGNMLKQGYAKEVAKKKARNMGFTLSEQKLEDGTIRLTARR